MKRFVLERHVLGAPLSAYDTAWDALGWSEGLGAARADRLAESVPWGTALARTADPPRLRGPLAQVRARLDSFRFAVLPVEGALAFSLWGAALRRSDHEWQVLTHTLLIDADAFRALAGNPFFLLDLGDWLRELCEGEPFATRRRIEPLVIDDDGALARASEAHRLAEIERLSAGVSRDRVTAVWRGLMDGPVAVHDARLARLAWLALPFEDRARIALNTGQPRAGRRVADLMVLEPEWGDAFPEGVRPAPTFVTDPSAGLRVWSSSLGDVSLHRAFSARARARRWSLLRGDVDASARALELRAAWSGERGPELAAELLAAESASPGGRVRAAGWMLGLALQGREQDASARADAALYVVAKHAGDAATRAVRGVVRGLRSRASASDREAAALVRLRASRVRPSLAPVAELRRVAFQEATLLDDAASPAVLTAMLDAAALHSAPAALLAQPIVRALAQTETALLSNRPWLVGAGVPAALAFAVQQHPRAARPVLRALLPEAAAAAPLDPASEEAVVRIAWTELEEYGESALSDLGSEQGTLALLAQLFVARIPKPLFVRVRAALLELAAHGTAGTLPPRAAAASPALAEAFAAERSRELVLIEGA